MLYSNIKWTIDRELDYLKLDKRCTLNQSTSLDITISDDENLTIADTLIDFKINIVEEVEEKLLIQEYKKQIEKIAKNKQKTLDNPCSSCYLVQDDCRRQQVP